MNNTMSMISLSFDDGRLDNYTIAAPILKKYGLPATFNITTSYVLHVPEARTVAAWEEAMTPEMLRELADNPNFEIAGHGDYHENTYEDISAGIDKLMPLIQGTLSGNRSEIGFASPGSGFDASNSILVKRLAEDGVCYIRLGLRYKSMQWVKVLCRKASRVIRIPVLYKWAYADCLMDEKDCGSPFVYSVPILSCVPMPLVYALIDKAINEKKHLVLMLHSVKKEIEYLNDMSELYFDQLCGYLKSKQDKGDIHVVTTKEMHKNL